MCGFTNKMVQQKIKPMKYVGEIAPWISNLISVFENNEHIELHVISPHQYIRGTKKFSHCGIHYYFVNQGIPLAGKNWPSIFPLDLWTDYYMFRKKIKSLVEKINPDIIHLHGAENTYHSSAIMQFSGEYPVFVTVQGIINQSGSETKRVLRRKQREKEIFRTFRHFGYRTETMVADIKKMSSEAVLHKHHYLVRRVDIHKTEKLFDLVFFARVTREKGIEDLIHAISIIKLNYPAISLCVIGSGRIEKLKQMAAELGVEENIVWAGFLPEHSDVHELASKAKISVLPTYHEIISGTIVESMFLQLPVVAYDVGSIHEVNKHEIIISLVEKGDVNGLAAAIIELLDNEDLRKTRGERGRERALEMFVTEKQQIEDELLQLYRSIIGDFRKSMIG